MESPAIPVAAASFTFAATCRGEAELFQRPRAPGVPGIWHEAAGGVQAPERQDPIVVCRHGVEIMQESGIIPRVDIIVGLLVISC